MLEGGCLWLLRRSSPETSLASAYARWPANGDFLTMAGAKGRSGGTTGSRAAVHRLQRTYRRDRHHDYSAPKTSRGSARLRKNAHDALSREALLNPHFLDSRKGRQTNPQEVGPRLSAEVTAVQTDSYGPASPCGQGVQVAMACPAGHCHHFCYQSQSVHVMCSSRTKVARLILEERIGARRAVRCGLCIARRAMPTASKQAPCGGRDRS